LLVQEKIIAIFFWMGSPFDIKGIWPLAFFINVDGSDVLNLPVILFSRETHVRISHANCLWIPQYKNLL